MLIRIYYLIIIFILLLFYQIDAYSFNINHIDHIHHNKLCSANNIRTIYTDGVSYWFIRFISRTQHQIFRLDYDSDKQSFVYISDEISDDMSKFYIYS